MIVLGVRSLAQKPQHAVRDLCRAGPPVPGVRAVSGCGGGRGHEQRSRAWRCTRLIPDGQGLAALLGIAAVAALLSNVVNNLPAVLVMLPLVSTAAPAAVLAVLIGVNIGPNLTYPGSPANLLWRGVVHRDGMPARFTEFSRVGLCTTPLTLIAAVVCSWAVTRAG